MLKMVILDHRCLISVVPLNLLPLTRMACKIESVNGPVMKKHFNSQRNEAFVPRCGAMVEKKIAFNGQI